MSCSNLFSPTLDPTLRLMSEKTILDVKKIKEMTSSIIEISYFHKIFTPIFMMQFCKIYRISILKKIISNEYISEIFFKKHYKHFKVFFSTNITHCVVIKVIQEQF